MCKNQIASESPSDNLFIVLGLNLASKSNSIIIIIKKGKKQVAKEKEVADFIIEINRS